MGKYLSCALVALAFLALGGCSPDPSTAPTTRPSPTPSSKVIEGGPNCKLPIKKPMPEWVPEDVPLPDGTYFYKALAERKGLHRGRFVLRIDTTEFGRFVKTRWVQQGISLGRQDSEPGEVEALFRTSTGFGIFKANDVVCDPPYATLLLISGS